MFGPPMVGFGEKNDVRLEIFEEASINVSAAVLHEDVGGDERYIRLAGTGHDFLAGETGVGTDLEELSGKGRGG